MASSTTAIFRTSAPRSRTNPGLEANLLITHHTLIFDLVNIISKRLSDTLKSAIDNDISLYTMHMNFDKAEGGVNDVLAELLELINITNLAPGKARRNQ